MSNLDRLKQLDPFGSSFLPKETKENAMKALERPNFSKLHTACKQGNIQIVKALLAHGGQEGDVNQVDDLGSTPLAMASGKGHIEIVKFLLDEGADVNLYAKDRPLPGSPLLFACQTGHYDIVQLLLENGAEVNMQGLLSFTPLIVASDYKIAKLLIEKGAAVNMQDSGGDSALTAATQKGHYDLVRLLLDEGADVNLLRNHGVSALMIAIILKHGDIAKLLIERHADVNLQVQSQLTPLAGWSALMMACVFYTAGIAELLIEHGAEVNTRNDNGESALFLACKNGFYDIAQLLIEKGTEIDVQTAQNGYTALIIASSVGNKDIVKLLIENGADVNIKERTNGAAAVDHAINEGHGDIVELLLNSCNKQSKVQEAPLARKGKKTTPPPSNLEHAPNCKYGKREAQSLITHTESMSKQPKLNEPDELTLQTLTEELKTVTDPIQLGAVLGVPLHQLKIIEKNYPQDIKKLQIFLFSFIAKNSLVLGITWGKIADVLEKEVGMGNLVINIREKFLVQTKEPSARSITDEPVVIDHTVMLFKKQVIGRGAFGTVFKGQYAGKPCAVKVLLSLADEIQTSLPTSEHATKDTPDQFHKECEHLESFEHTNVVRHLATKMYPRTDHLVLVLELMDCNLRQYFTPQPGKDPVQLSLTVQTSLCLDIASALEYIHSRGVVHRDLCSENILLACGGETPVAKVCDFGMSRLVNSERRSVSSLALGRIGYMAPEAANSEVSCYNSKSDMFSFGVLMIQIVRQLPTIKDKKMRDNEIEQINNMMPIKSNISMCLCENRDNRPSASQVKKNLQGIYNFFAKVINKGQYSAQF